MKGISMSIFKDLSDLCIELRNEARQNKQFELADKIFSIQDKIKEIQDENYNLRKELEIRDKIKYDEDGQSFTLNNDDNIHYCATCYGQSKKLIPMTRHKENNNLICKICWEINMNHFRPH